MADDTPATTSWQDWQPIGIAAVVALLVGGGLIILFGQVAAYSRPTVLRGLTETVYWLAASIIGACGTIAALMLTTVGLLEHLETRRLTPRFLFHLRVVVTAALTTIGLAVLALLLTVLPASGSEEIVPQQWIVTTVYWSLLVVTALMIAGFATVLAALSTTIREVFHTLPHTWVEEILETEPEDLASPADTAG